MYKHTCIHIYILIHNYIYIYNSYIDIDIEREGPREPSHLSLHLYVLCCRAACPVVRKDSIG